MNTRHKLLAVALAAASLALPLGAQARLDVDINIAPPPPRYEVVPPPRVGFVWAPGYWAWDGGHHRHTWRKGQYIRERHGERWTPSQWAERDGRYHFDPGHWQR
ncbi:MAG: YXWGXW repeat-containing protein [Casimicrobiaceae bacterium]